MIEFRNVSKEFESKDKKVQALKNVTLEIEEGDIYGIIGFSGAGKSTLLRVINALEKPTAGEVLIGGEDINKLSAKALRAKRKQIGMIFQQFHLLETATVYENVALPLKLNKVPKARSAGRWRKYWNLWSFRTRGMSIRQSSQAARSSVSASRGRLRRNLPYY